MLHEKTLPRFFDFLSCIDRDCCLLQRDIQWVTYCQGYVISLVFSLFLFHLSADEKNSDGRPFYWTFPLVVTGQMASSLPWRWA